MAIRQATAADIERATETIRLAFAGDPVWSIALARADGRTDHHAGYWRRFVVGALEGGEVWLVDDGAAVSMWVPPDGEEISAAGFEELGGFNLEALGPTGRREVEELYERFESNHPRAEPHAYLSILATHPDHRGHGTGQALLAANLARWDALGLPAYLESTNPANDHRYVRAGFRQVGGFTAVRDGAPITTMWRTGGGAG